VTTFADVLVRCLPVPTLMQPLVPRAAAGVRLRDGDRRPRVDQPRNLAKSVTVE
jgi:hypothetical protein